MHKKIRDAVVPLTLLAVLAPLILLATPALAQGGEDVQIETIAITDHLHMLIGQGGNIGVSSGADGVFLVDDQYAPLSAKIKAAVKEISSAPIRFVINTHWHGDHTGGNENFGKDGALIVAHDKARARMSVEQFHEFFKNTSPAMADEGLPVVTFNDTVTFHLNGEEVHAIHLPTAHTDGDAIIHFRRANVIHTGDIYFNGLYPFIDVWTGGSIDGFIAAVDKILSLADDQTKIIPGHGPLSNRAEIAAYRDMLKKVRGKVAALVAQGKSLEETIAAGPSAEYDEKLGNGYFKPAQFVTFIYESLKRANDS